MSLGCLVLLPDTPNILGGQCIFIDADAVNRTRERGVLSLSCHVLHGAYLSAYAKRAARNSFF